MEPYSVIAYFFFYLAAYINLSYENKKKITEEVVDFR